MRKVLLSILTSVYAVSFASEEYQLFTKKTPINIEADKIIREDKKVIAKGDVTVIYKGYTLKADTVIYDEKSKKIILKGNVTLKGKKIHIYAKEGWIDIENKNGEFKDITLIVDNRYFVKAKKIKKVGDVFYFKKGEFSQCRFDKYDWYIKAHEGKIKPNDKLIAKNLTFRFFNIPVFYSPYFTYPTIKRKTGFLVPEVGRDTYNNLFVKLPYFYVINDSSDITTTIDYRSKQGEGLDIQYRRKLSKDTGFEIEFFYFRDKGSGGWWEGRDTSPLNNRWRFRGKGKFRWKDFHIYTTLDIPSDPYFYEDFYNASDLRYLSYTKSQILATLNKKKYTLEINANYIYDLSSPTNRYTLQRLPEIRFYYKKFQLFPKYPVYADFLSVNTNFYRESGEKAIRSDNAINIGLYTPFGRFYNDFEIVPRYTAYFFINGNLKNSRYRSLVQIRDILRYYIYNRFKDFNLSTIPQVSFDNVPASSQGKLPYFDKEDRIKEKSDIDFSLFNIANIDNNDFFRWELSTGYSRKGKYYISDTEYKGYWKPLKNSILFKINSFEGEELLFYDWQLGYITRTITSLTIPVGDNIKYSIVHSFDKGIDKPSLNQIYQNIKINYKNFIIEGSLLNNIKFGYTQQKKIKVTYNRNCWSFSLKYIEDYNVDSGKTFSSVVLAVNILSTEYRIPFIQTTGSR